MSGYAGLPSLTPVEAAIRARLGVPETATDRVDLLGSMSVIAGPANAIRVYSDTGDNYEFGCEGGTASNFQPVGSTVAGEASILENGPLRCTATTEATFTAVTGTLYTYRRTYTLVGGEPFLRMSLTGAAPKITDVSASRGVSRFGSSLGTQRVRRHEHARGLSAPQHPAELQRRLALRGRLPMGRDGPGTAHARVRVAHSVRNR